MMTQAYLLRDILTREMCACLCVSVCARFAVCVRGHKKHPYLYYHAHLVCDIIATPYKDWSLHTPNKEALKNKQVTQQ